MSQFPNKKSEYDLEERTAKFAEVIIEFVKEIKKDHINLSIITQLIRSGTSVGANYCEANGASSKKDFRNKIHICKKEIQETKYWLRILSKTNPEMKEMAKKIWKEAQELTLIFQKIISYLKKKNNGEL
jgi:four helix bundle protein